MGRREIPLSPDGEAQVAALVPMLRALAPERILTSPLLRARATAEILARELGVPVAVEHGLVELDFGEWEGRFYDELVADPAYLAFSADPRRTAPPDGETATAAQARAVGTLTRALVAGPGARLCVVSHGDVLRALLAAALSLDLREFRRLRLDTGGVSAVELTGDWAEVKFVNVLADPARVLTPVHWGP